MQSLFTSMVLPTTICTVSPGRRKGLYRVGNILTINFIPMRKINWFIFKNKTGFLALLVTLFCQPGFAGTPFFAGTPLGSYTGIWTNVNRNTRDIVKIELDVSGPHVTVHVWGACQPTPCDWGAKSGIAYSNSVSESVTNNTEDISVMFPQGFATTTLMIRADGAGRIVVTNLTQFTDGSGRDNYTDVQTFERDKGAGFSAPFLLSPKCGSVFNFFPRTTRLQWQSVNGASSYTVEIDCLGCCAIGKWCTDAGKTWQVVRGIKGLGYTFDFVGAQPGRWRVWAVGNGNEEGPKSEWCEFTYTK
jgi:hypothetical protein